MSVPFTPQEIASEGITPQEYEEIVKRLGRHPNKAELGMFGVMWSEHCCYKNSRPLLSQFPTTGDRILVGPGENAGIVDLGDGIHLAFKVESHNHPSAIEPFQGAATGVGGILRDIFTMGARPIALLNSLRFGNLDNPRTRRIFTGVIEGISHYGNCLIGEETLIWRDQNGVHFDTIGNFVNSRLPENTTTFELKETIKTLSLDQHNHACWQPITRLFKRQTNQLITIKTALGRSLTFTPDHQCVILTEEGLKIVSGQDLKEGDTIPLLINLPVAQNNTNHIDLISCLKNIENVYIDLPENYQFSDHVKAQLKIIEPDSQIRHRYQSKGYLPLKLFLEIESELKLDRQEIRIYKRSGKANYVEGVINFNDTFARLLGYYLAEGCVSTNGNSYKIIFTFAHHETEYIDDVIQGLKELNLNPCVEKRESTIVVYATSWLLGYLLKEVWQCGDKANNKTLPPFIFNWNHTLQKEILKGLFRGDGSFTNKTNGSHGKITFATTSHQLFEQTLILLQSQGVMPYIYCRQGGECEIEGRKVNRLPLWQLEITNIDGLSALVDIFGKKQNQALKEALTNYQGHNHSFPRYQISNQLAFIKIKNVETLTVDNENVYDIEVENTHLFVTTSGIITHNCVGVPTVGGEVYFDSAYTGNPLVNVMALGLMETSDIVKSGASGVGNPVLYVGSTTGRDGMGGASFASAELTDASMDDRPAVQVGDPFTEKSLIEACLEAFKTGAVVAAQDMGAAGITCSTSEMAQKGGLGIELDLDKIPVRETGMIPYEYLLSESQERMLFVAQKGREQELIDIFHRWGLQAVVAGEVIAESLVRILFQGNIAAEIPATALADNTPIYHRELLKEAPEYAQKAWTWRENSLSPCDTNGININGNIKTYNDILLDLLDSPTIASKQWVYRQYDHQVQNNTYIMPGGSDASVVRLRPSNKGVAATTDCNPKYVYLNPYEGAKSAVAEAARNLSCVGALPLAVTDNLNFGSPEKAIGYWQLAKACQGISEACETLNTPVTGGNVSLYNETLDSDGTPQPIHPAPVIGMVGYLEDVTKACGQGFKNTGDIIYLLGINHDNLPVFGGSEYLDKIHNLVTGQPPKVNFELEKQVQLTCREGINHNLIKSAHDCAEGGLTVALAESCISGNKGAKINLNTQENQRLDNLLFGEVASYIIVSISSKNISQFEQFLKENLRESYAKIGEVSDIEIGLQVKVNNFVLIDLKIEQIQEKWSRAIERRLS